MAVLQFKLEYFHGASGPTDDGVFIQLRTEVAAYQHIITKEVYFSNENSNHSDFVTALFNIPGVVRVSSQAWRVYVEKSPVFKWTEVLGVPVEQGVSLLDGMPPSPSVMNTIMSFCGCDSVHELNGSGITLNSQDDRRAF